MTSAQRLGQGCLLLFLVVIPLAVALLTHCK